MSAEPDERPVRDRMQAIAHALQEVLPKGYGFVLLAFRPTGQEAELDYVSNRNRADVVRAMREFITMTEARWGEHIGESDEDTELGRLRQRIETLQRKQERLFESGWAYGRHYGGSSSEAWKMFLESIGDQ